MISKEDVLKIAEKYRYSLFGEAEADDALRFVFDVLCAQADKLKAEEPDAKRTIDEYEAAAYIVHELRHEIF